MTGNCLLVDKCRKFILSNFDLILLTSDWTNLTKTEVIEFLSSNDLVVSDEFYLWEKVIEWLQKKYDEDEVAEVISDVIPLLHFTMISPKQLLEIEKSELFSKYKSVFVEKLNAAYRHHSLLLDQVELRGSTEQFRNYTSEKYGICFELDIPQVTSSDKAGCKIKDKLQVPVEFMSAPGGLKENNKVCFDFTFWPRGAVKSFSWTGRLSENVTLSIIHSSSSSFKKADVEVDITFLAYGIRNSLRYVAFAYTNRHKFTRYSNLFIEENLLSVKRLNEKDSPYLVNGNLEAKVFIKIVNVESHDTNT